MCSAALICCLSWRKALIFEKNLGNLVPKEEELLGCQYNAVHLRAGLTDFLRWHCTEHALMLVHTAAAPATPCFFCCAYFVK